MYPGADGGEVDEVLVRDVGDEAVRGRGARERRGQSGVDTRYA